MVRLTNVLCITVAIHCAAAVCIVAAAATRLTAQQGSYIAGHEVYTAIDANRGGRELLTDVWYPVDTPDSVGQPPLQYYQHYNAGADFWWYDSPFFGGVQSAPASTDGPFPLVVLSHGFGGATLSFQLLAETLATNGYVVAAPRHTGNAWGTPDFDTDHDRPIDVTFITDNLIDRSGQINDILFEAVDADHIGLGGYSWGVDTIRGTLTGVGPDNAAVPADTRARAALFIDRTVPTTIDVPILHVGGGDYSFAGLSGSRQAVAAYGLDLDNAHHWSFGTNLCQYVDELNAAGAPEAVFETTGMPENYSEDFWPGCQEGVIDLLEAQTLLAEHAFAFFETHLRGNDSSKEILLPEAESFTLNIIVDFAPVSPRNSDVELLLTTPDGRRLGNDPIDGIVNDFPGGTASHEAMTSVQRFLISAGEAIEGTYVLSGSTGTLFGGRSLQMQSSLLENRGPHAVSVRIASADSPVARDSDIEPIEFVFQRPDTVGDYNEDGVVNAADYTVWRNNLGAPAGTLPNDTSGNVIGPAQFDVWKTNYGMGSSATAVSPQDLAVPEPGSELMVILAVAAAFVRFGRTACRASSLASG